MSTNTDIFYLGDIGTSTNNNTYYRNVIFTSPDDRMQLVLMSIKPGEEIGMEKHNEADQFIMVEKGSGRSVYGKDKNNLSELSLGDGSAIIIPANVWHNIKNSGNEDLKLYTLYSPAQHKDKLIQAENKPIIQDGGNIPDHLYYKKYLRYKNKYLTLKNNF